MSDHTFKYLLSLHDKCHALNNFSLIKCSGSDTVRFLNGQLTNDVSKLIDGHFQRQVRLNRSGQVQFFFYLLKFQDKEEDKFYILTLNELRDSIIDDLNKFIIMDDVVLTKSELRATIQLSWKNDLSRETFKGSWASLPASIILDSNFLDETLPEEDFKTLSLLGGEPLWGKTIKHQQLVTDSVAMLDAVSLTKGCFLGQETVAKIESRRGGAFFPILLDPYIKTENNILTINNKKVGEMVKAIEIDKRSVAVISLIRNYRVQGKKIDFDQDGGGIVNYLPMWDLSDPDKYAKEVYEQGVSYFQDGDEERAIALLNVALQYKEDYADAYEALGVILGRNERFEEAIALMDKLGAADPDSVMAHTNKSLYLMKLGKIEEAEEEKAQATLKSFASFGRVAQTKKELAEKDEAEKKELERRESMFRQVLEIDPEDTLANFGLADIEFKKKNYNDSCLLLDKVLKADSKYSVGYALLAKSLLALNKNSEAKAILNTGIEIASANGDLMPANEMQELLNKMGS